MVLVLTVLGNGNGALFWPQIKPKQNFEFSLCLSLCRHYVSSMLKNTICVQVLNWIFHWVIKISVTFQ